MNRELFDLLKKGTIDTDDDFYLFYKYSDDVISDNYTYGVITDIRLYLLEKEGVFCEIYADIDKSSEEWDIRNIETTQNIRYFINGEDGYSFSDVQIYFWQKFFALFNEKYLLRKE